MAHGGDFGADNIEHFNGNLFDATEALDLTVEELKALQAVILLDWSNIDPSIFGTLVRGSRKWPRPHRDPRDVHDGR